MVEANPFFNYSSYINLLKKMDSMQISRYGPCGYLYDDNDVLGATDRYIEDTFKKDKTNIEHILMPKVKGNGVHFGFPLLLELSTIDTYLLVGVDVRIRLDPANQDWIIKSST